uniref:solute carrier family 22 member 6-B-like n=1 Tax=Myxine glutinosa TaxID=7769 RepID=UPI00358E51CE
MVGCDAPCSIFFILFIYILIWTLHIGWLGICDTRLAPPATCYHQHPFPFRNYSLQFRRRSFECLRTDGGTTRHHISSPELRSSLHPESARWLLLQGRHEEALKLLKRVARINRKQLTEADLNIQVLKKEMEKEKNIQSDHSSSPLDLLRVKELRKQTFVLSISWFTILFCYYGIALNLEVIKIDIFLLLVIFGVLDLPMLLVSMAMMSYFGRRIVLCGLLLISSCTFFALTLMPADQLVVRAAFAVIGRMVIAAEFNAIMLLTGELYPTVVRWPGRRYW